MKGQENGVYKLISNGTECPSGSTVEVKYDVSFRIVNSSHSKNNHRENSHLGTDNYPPVIQCLKRNPEYLFLNRNHEPHYFSTVVATVSSVTPNTAGGWHKKLQWLCSR